MFGALTLTKTLNQADLLDVRPPQLRCIPEVDDDVERFERHPYRLVQGSCHAVCWTCQRR